MHSRQPDVHEATATKSATEYRAYRPGDEAAFGVDRDGAAEWRRVHERAPGGNRTLVAAAADGSVVGYVSAIAQHVWLGGERKTFARITGAAHGGARPAGLARRGALLRLGDAWIAQNLGARDVLAWCTPRSVRAWRLAKFGLGFAVIRTQDRLVADARAWRGAAAPGVDVVESARPPEDADEFFEHARAPYPSIQVRDREFLEWRFAAAAAARYVFGTARRAGRTVGLAVFRDGAFAGEAAGIACEWLVDPADDGARAALCSWLGERTAAAGRARLVTALADSSPEWLALQRLGMRVEPTDVFVCGLEPGRGNDTRKLYHEWYWTLADTDLV